MVLTLITLAEGGLCRLSFDTTEDKAMEAMAECVPEQFVNKGWNGKIYLYCSFQRRREHHPRGRFKGS